MTTAAPPVNVQDIPVDLTTVRGRGVDVGEYFDGPWAILPERAQNTLNYLKHANIGLHIGAHQNVAPHADEDSQEPRVQVTKHPAGNNTAVAVINIVGTMMKGYSSLFQTACTPHIRREVRQAANDPSVAAIVLRIDSPGGTTSGTSDLGDDIRAAAQKKPVLAFVEDLGASAAYWVASQCDGVFANSKTALIGSIGTFIGLYDQSEQFQNEGIRAVVIKSSELKGTGFQGAEITEEQEAYLQDIVAKVEAEFEQAIRTGRKMSKKQVAAVATGRVWAAADAQALGLIDDIESIDAVIVRAARMAKKRGTNNEATIADDMLDNELVNSAAVGAKPKGDDDEDDEEDEDNPTVDPTSPEDQAGNDTKDTDANGAADTQESTNGKANAMSGQDDTPATKPDETTQAATTPGAATAAELKAALPNASGDFIVGQLTKGATVAQATSAYAMLLDEQNKTLADENKTLRSAGTSGVNPVSGGGPTGQDAATPATEEVDTKVTALMAGGMKRHEAHAKVMRDNPELRQRLVAESNADRKIA